MKTNFKNLAGALIIATIAVVWGCKKDANAPPATSTQNNTTDNYSSMSDFFAVNGVSLQTYTVDASSGGSFTTSQGTAVTIPANSFYTQQWQSVTGQVSISFKDIYKKSDMLLSNMPTNTHPGVPLKSGGEFYIKATQGGQSLNFAGTITVKQPLGSFPIDSNMRSFFKPGDSLGWIVSDTFGYVEPALADYVFSLYKFTSPIDSGTWCNSDNSYYFSAYPQTLLTLQESDDPATYDTYVFLVFKNIDAMVHVYNGNGYAFPYYYAPVGLQCTVVAVGIKDGKVYSSFTPITISANQTVTFSMNPTTTADFKSQLAALN